MEKYVSSVTEFNVLVWRNKIGAHIAITDPRKDDNIATFGRPIDQARSLEHHEIASQLVKLKQVLTDFGAFGDPKTKLLSFTEHKDTLDYLAGDGKDYHGRS